MTTPPHFSALPRARDDTSAPSGIAYYTGGGSGEGGEGGGEGNGAPLLFIHGVGLSADCWQKQLAAFEPHTPVFAVDLPGHGESPPFSDFSEKSPTMDDFVEKISDFIKDKIGRAVALVGHSLGALIALQLAAAQPRWVSRVAVLSPVYQRSRAARQAVEARADKLAQIAGAAGAPSAADTLRQLHEDTLARWFGAPPQMREDWQPAAAACRHWLRQTRPAAYAAAYRVFARHDAADTPLPRLRQPLLALTGDADPNSTADMSRQLAAAAKSAAAASAVIIAGHAHLLQLTAAVQVNAALTQWMGETP